MKECRSLVFGPGGLTGAFGAGVGAELCRLVGPDYFDTVYASSVGVFVASYLVANQPDVIEYFWRNLVHSRQLVNVSNILSGLPLLDLDYLIRVYRSPGTALDLGAVFRSRTRLVFAVTNYESGATNYVEPRPDTIFDLMRASCAVPVAYPSPVFVDGVRYIDGGLSDPLPVVHALADSREDAKVVVVSNRRRGEEIGKLHHLSRLLSPIMSPVSRRLLGGYTKRVRQTSLVCEQDPRIVLVRPTRPLGFRHFFDTRELCINAAVDAGIREAALTIALAYI